MKLLQVALLFTFVMLVAHVAAVNQHLNDDVDHLISCESDSDCYRKVGYSAVCVTRDFGIKHCELLYIRREGGADKIWT